MASPFPRSPVIHGFSWKETKTEKTETKTKNMDIRTTKRKFWNNPLHWQVLDWSFSLQKWMMAEIMLDEQYTLPLEVEFHKQISSVSFKHLVLNERKVYSNSSFSTVNSQQLVDIQSLAVWSMHSSHYLEVTSKQKIAQGCVRYILLVYFVRVTERVTGETCTTRSYAVSFTFRSWHNQILNFPIFKCHDVIKCLKHETYL